MAVGNEQPVEETLQPAGVLMPVTVVVPRPGPLIMLVLTFVVTRQPGGSVAMIVAAGLFHFPVSAVEWWWRGVPPRECSAWNIASVTSWRACSFSSR